jgi:hypothetical protein
VAQRLGRREQREDLVEVKEKEEEGDGIGVDRGE